VDAPSGIASLIFLRQLSLYPQPLRTLIGNDARGHRLRLVSLLLAWCIDPCVSVYFSSSALLLCFYLELWLTRVVRL